MHCYSEINNTINFFISVQTQKSNEIFDYCSLLLHRTFHRNNFIKRNVQRIEWSQKIKKVEKHVWIKVERRWINGFILSGSPSIDFWTTYLTLHQWNYWNEEKVDAKTTKSWDLRAFLVELKFGHRKTCHKWGSQTSLLHFIRNDCLDKKL